MNSPQPLASLALSTGLALGLFATPMTVGAASADTGKPEVTKSPWADFVERDFPFFSSVLDARQLGKDFPTNNLTPRGLIINLGNDCWACFDTELLRVSAIWTGKGVTPASMAQGSYHQPGHKAPEGQEKLPRIVGTPWIATGLYPGWQSGKDISLLDPRDPGPDPQEPGRGPLPDAFGHFEAIQLTEHGACLVYSAQKTKIREWIASQKSDGHIQVERRFLLDAAPEPLWLVLGRGASAKTNKLTTTLIKLGANSSRLEQTNAPDGSFVVAIGPSKTSVEFIVRLGMGITDKNSPSVSSMPHRRPKQRWSQTIVTRIQRSAATNAYVVDDVPLPLQNPWHRNVRLADLAFFPDGRAAAVTFDGDVWIIGGLGSQTEEVTWHRFASGLHE